MLLADLDRDALRELVHALGWLALDVAQHLNFTVTFVSDERLAGALTRAHEMAEMLADFPFGDLRDPGQITPGLVVFGPDGLEGWSS